MTIIHSNPEQRVSFKEALRVWLKIGWLSFGGPAAQIALMHRIIVEEKHWIDEQRFLHALNYCMLLPGPEAQQLATYIGWLLHRTRGGLTAGLAFILPGFFIILLLSIAYALYQTTGWFNAIFFGIKAAVLAIVVQAVMRIGKRALKNRTMYILAGTAFIAIFFFHIPFPLIILSAALFGFLSSRHHPNWLPGEKADSHNNPRGIATQNAFISPASGNLISWQRTLRVLFIGLVLWWIPVIYLYIAFGNDHVLTQEAWFFSKMAVVTFGGAYAVLSYVAQAAVQTYAWLSPGEMIDGLGLAETTPGPLIMVTEFVGFLAAYRHAPEFHPLTAGIIGAIVTTWVTFVPCFLWIFLGAPYVEKLRENRRLSAALSCITAAVVGVILNLSLWFALHVMFDSVRTASGYGFEITLPNWQSINVPAVALIVLAMIAVLRLNIGILRVILICAVISMLYHYLWPIGV